MAENLAKFVISASIVVALSVIILVGIAVTNGYSKALRTETQTNASDIVAVASLGAPNSSNAIVTTYPFLQELTSCGNLTNLSSTEGSLLPTNFYTISEGSATGGTITLNQDGVGWEGTSINCSNVVYLLGTNAQISADRFSTGLATFGTFTIILILAIIGQAIIKIFKNKK